MCYYLNGDRALVLHMSEEQIKNAVTRNCESLLHHAGELRENE